jgi:hypothetical protein
MPTDNPIALSADESLVLFELLSRLLHEEKAANLLRLIKHDAEIWVLNSLQGQLERTVAASLSPEYQALVEAARSNLLAVHGGSWPPLQTK